MRSEWRLCGGRGGPGGGQRGSRYPPCVASHGLFLLSGCLGWSCPSPPHCFLFSSHWSEAWAGAWPSPRAPVHTCCLSPSAVTDTGLRVVLGFSSKGKLPASRAGPGRRDPVRRAAGPRPEASGPGERPGHAQADSGILAPWVGRSVAGEVGQALHAAAGGGCVGSRGAP